MPEGRPGLRIEPHGAVALLTLDRPDALNALDRPLKEALREAIEAGLEDAAVRSFVVTGAGRGFCVGQDLREVSGDGTDGSARPDFEALIVELYNPLVLAIHRSEKPVVAAVNGPAAGAGMSLALACDVRLASSRASFTPAFGRVGLVPDSGMSWFLPRLIGSGRAADILLTGRTVEAEEAARIGLVSRVVEPDALLEAALALAGALADASPLATALTKRELALGAELPLEQALGLEAQLQGIAGRSADHAEGLAAFREKRPPRFEGR